MVDVFHEVDERLRTDRYSGLVRKATPWAIGLVVLILVVAAGFGGYGYYQRQAAQKASQAYGEGQEALSRGDAAAAFLKFAAAAKAGSPIYTSLAEMQQAGIRLTAGDTASAVGLLDAAAKDAPNQVIGDAARLKSALALLDTASLADMEARLTPLADAKRPFHILAREAIAMAKLRAGKFADAKADFTVLSTSLDATDGVRQIASAAIVMIDDGAAASVGPIVKTALTLPPPPPATGQSFQGAGAAQ